MTTKKLTKWLALYLPYILLGLVATNFGEAWRLAEGKELGDKIKSPICSWFVPPSFTLSNTSFTINWFTIRSLLSSILP